MNVSEQLRFEFVVIGSGPAGVSGAIAAGILGKRVALIEKEAVVGGAGINTGTIPSKTLRETALVLSGGRSRRLFSVDLSLRREATIADFMCHERLVGARHFWLVTLVPHARRFWGSGTRQEFRCASGILTVKLPKALAASATIEPQWSDVGGAM